MKKTYFLKTFGCQQNERDSEIIADYYESRGYKPAKKIEETDVVVINSCSVRQSAEHRVYGLINNINKLKARAKNLKLIRPKIILTGCMIGLYGEEALKETLPTVYQFKEISDWKIDDLSKQGYVNIMSGCNNFCSYCVVPYARGREESRPIEEIIDEVKKLIKKGITEITLLGQNVNSYGKKSKIPPSFCNAELQRASKNLKRENIETPFALLLKMLHQILGIKKIYFMTSNPWDLDGEIIEAMSLPKIDRYLHLPMQSGDDEILKRMNRKYTAKQYLELVKKIRKKIPEIRIGTDIIVGFPGETEKAFQNTVNLCKKVGFVKAYIAIYSPRPKTRAYELRDDISYKVKKERWRILENLINKQK